MQLRTSATNGATYPLKTAVPKGPLFDQSGHLNGNLCALSKNSD